MSLGVEIKFADAATPALQRLVLLVQQPALRAALGGGIAKTARTHLRRLERERANKLGGKRTNFYGRAAKAVQRPEVTPTGVVVSINQRGLAQRYFGGDIEPGPGKEWLAIPARAEAYGQRPRDREQDDLHFVLFRAGLAALVQNEQTSLRDRSESGGGIFYWLVKQVHQEADPTVLPSHEEFATAAVAAGDAHLATLTARAQGKS